MECRFSLLRHLQFALGEIGWPIPVCCFNDKSKFVISLDTSKIPHCSASTGEKDPKLFTGLDRYSPLTAEHKAVMATMRYLDECYGLHIRDMSHAKIRTLETDIAQVVDRILDLKARLHSCLREYQAAINLLGSFRADFDGHPRADMLEMVKSLSSLENAAQSSAALIHPELFVIDRKCSLFLSNGSARHVQNDSNDDPLICKISEKEFLADILRVLQRSAAFYNLQSTEDGLFKASCHFEAFSNSGSFNLEPIVINGEANPSAVEAEDSAAARAIECLEKLECITVVDFNYDYLAPLQKKHLYTTDLHSECEVVFSHAKEAWSDFVRSLESFIGHQYDLAKASYDSNDPFGDYDARFLFANALDQVLYKIWSMQHRALSDRQSAGRQ